MALLYGNHFVVGLVQFPVIVWVQRNASDYITSAYGMAIDMMQWLSRRYHFTYSYLQVKDRQFNPVKAPELPGLSHYLFNEKCDLVFGANVHNDVRWNTRVRITEGFATLPSLYMIRMPIASHAPGAIVKPFAIEVWIGLFISLLVVIALLGLFLKIGNRLSRNRFKTTEPSSGASDSSSTLFSFAYQYAIGVLLNQGAFCFDAKLAIRLLAASWCLAAFVFTNAFNCLLTSFLATPDSRPLITYTEDLTDREVPNDMYVIYVVGTGFLEIISGAKDGVYKHVWKHIMAHPITSQCNTTAECVDRVKLGNHVFVAGGLPALAAISDDFKATGKCNLAVALRKNTRTHTSTWCMRKDAKEFEFFQRGIMEMNSYGLMAHWTKRHQPDTRLCLEQSKKLMEGKREQQSSTVTSRLSLNNLSGAFAALLAGYVASFTLFCLERATAAIKRSQSSISQSQ